jgi:hypothetical protein
MQNLLSINEFKQHLAEHERVALLVFDPEDESSRCAFRNIAEATYLGENIPVFVADVKEVDELQAHYQLTGIPSLLFFVKGKVVEEITGCRESDFVKVLVEHSAEGLMK